MALLCKGLDNPDLEDKLNLTSVDLYGDDGLAVMKNHPGPKSRPRKKVTDPEFPVIWLTNHRPNQPYISKLYLDINLATGIHQPYRKPKDLPMFINAKSNHPCTTYYQAYPRRRKQNDIYAIINLIPWSHIIGTIYRNVIKLQSVVELEEISYA